MTDSSRNRRKDLTAAEIWSKYERGVERMAADNIATRAEICHRMYEGDQWYGIEQDGENLPKLNFIKPVINYKVAMVAKNDLSIVYSPLRDGNGKLDDRDMVRACELLSAHAAAQWERLKMAAHSWDTVKDAAITGYSLVYFPGDGDEVQIIDGTNVVLADETLADLQKQPYIIIYERRAVDDVKEDARAAGIDEDEVAGIVSDSTSLSQPADVDTNRPDDEQKCSCLLYFRKVDGVVTVTRSTRTVIYAAETRHAAAGGVYNDVRAPERYNKPRPEVGLSLYPMAAFPWARRHRRARGIGEAWGLVPNQIEVNRTLVRRSISNKQTGFPKIVYQQGAITNPAELTKPGAAIEVKAMGTSRPVDFMSYLAPMPMSSDAQILQSELLDISRNLAGAGEAAMGQVNPERASGAAIIAVQDQAAIPLNEQSATYRQFVEDIASVWFSMWAVRHTSGLTVHLDDDMPPESINPEVLERLSVSVRIDVSPTNPFSKFAREQSLENALAAGHITFDEYVEALDDDATAPKVKFKQVLEARAAAQSLPEALPQQGGGDIDAMSAMQGGGDYLPPPAAGGFPGMVMPQ